MNTTQLLEEWRSRTLLALLAYNRAANRCRKWDFALGVMVAVLTASVGTSVFVSLRNHGGTAAVVVVGSASVLATVLAAIQSFAGTQGRIDEYERAARRYGVLRRLIEDAEHALAHLGAEPDITAIRKELDQAAVDSVNAPSRIWNRARRQIKGDYTRLERATTRIRGLKRAESLMDPKFPKG